MAINLSKFILAAGWNVLLALALSMIWAVVLGCDMPTPTPGPAEAVAARPAIFDLTGYKSMAAAAAAAPSANGPPRFEAVMGESPLLAGIGPCEPCRPAPLWLVDFASNHWLQPLHMLVTVENDPNSDVIFRTPQGCEVPLIMKLIRRTIDLRDFAGTARRRESPDEP